MNEEMKQDGRYQELLSLVLGGAETDEQRLAFGKLLEEHPELVDDYLEQARLHVLLEASVGTPSEAPCELRPSRASQGPRRRWRLLTRMAAVVAFGLCVWQAADLLLLRQKTPVQPSVSEEGAVAMVRIALHAQWADGQPVVDGMPLKKGLWFLQSGLAELVTKDGTVLLLEAPAGVELKSTLHARLLSGKLVVRMPKGESGFVVDTPEMRVRDLGTEFGVSVSPGGEAQVQVFEGKVRAEMALTTVLKELTAGESACTGFGGQLVPTGYDEKRFIRRFPKTMPANRPSGVMRSECRLSSLRVAASDGPVTIDGDLKEWDRSVAFTNACEGAYAAHYWVEGMMRYDATHLYVAAQVGDPDPLCNRAPKGFEFAGGSVIVRVSADKAQGWPLKGSRWVNGVFDYTMASMATEARSPKIVSLMLWYDVVEQTPRIQLIYGLDAHRRVDNPLGCSGVFKKLPDGRGYVVEYAIPWALLGCSDDPPRAGDELPVLWQVHWSDAEGRLAYGQMVEVANGANRSAPDVFPYSYFMDGPTWGKAIYLPKGL